ncbi:amidase [Seohaeicola zhoushanensis]|uniref:Amidase n=1 Tax=Seohaeicola zhoushanensis TaxID=1569283 RepID=A0A8J3MAW1_9RHOB|nr:amidase [Seohaeicola zhoushanensis]GHF60247.1 amidase [Seohaeicola zhoushanensis]
MSDGILRAIGSEPQATPGENLTATLQPDSASTDATDLLTAFRAGQSDPVAVTEAHLTRIARMNPVLNAYSTLAADAVSQAEASRKRWSEGAPKGPLDGIPIILKDNLVSAGLPAAWGNAELARRMASADELPVAALRRAGAIFLGKGNTPEFAVEGYTGNLTFGVTGNPFNSELTPGGSSGGVVAAVASGMAVAGLATDGGGSIRRPAGYTGLWGLKPGIGTVARGGGLPQILLDFETVGPVTRSARDLILFHEVLTGRPHQATPTALRILAVGQIEDAPCDPAIRAAFAATIDRLRSLGCEVSEGPLPLDLGPLNAVWGRIVEIGLAHLAATDPPVMAAAARKYRDMAAKGAPAPATELFEALTRVAALRDAARHLWGFDAVLLPTAAAMPWPAGATHPDKIDGHDVGPRGHAVYTGWVNAAGLPGLAFPGGQSDGLPIGMQLIGPKGAEDRLLSLALLLDG